MARADTWACSLLADRKAELAELMLRFDQLFALFWDDPGQSRSDFASFVSAFLQHQAQFGHQEESEPPEEPAALVPDVEPESATEPAWPWPIAMPPAVDGAGFPELQAQHSGLWLCGYRVGRIYGLPDVERRRFLDHFFLSPLPSVVAQFHGDSYGAPGSRERLVKMANVIAAHCRNFRRNDARRYWIAIQQWDQDLRYLKETYGQRMPIAWPGTL